LAISIAVRPVAIHSSLVDIVCTLATFVPPSPEHMHWLLLQNRELRFGMLSLSDDGDVGLSHSLVGDTINPEQLRIVVPAFVETALELRKRLRPNRARSTPRVFGNGTDCVRTRDALEEARLVKDLTRTRKT
jgi:putative sensory transduction regulator